MRVGQLHATAPLLACACVVAVGCGLLPDMDSFTGGSVVDDAGSVRDAGTTVEDAGSVTDAGEPPRCVAGRIRGVAAFDGTPAGAKGTTCGTENALVADGLVTGLSADDYGGSVPFAGDNVHSCVGVEFADPVKTAYVRVSATGSACGRDCLTEYCGQGRYAEVFAAPSRGSYSHVVSLVTGATLADFTVVVPSTTHVVLVCRGGSSKDKDHVAVDAITAACQ